MGAPLCPMRVGAGPSVPSSLMQGEYMPNGTRYRVKRTAKYKLRIATCLTEKHTQNTLINICKNLMNERQIQLLQKHFALMYDKSNYSYQGLNQGYKDTSSSGGRLWHPIQLFCTLIREGLNIPGDNFGVSVLNSLAPPTVSFKFQLITRIEWPRIKGEK